MLKFVALPIAAAGLFVGAATAETGVPIPSALADKPTPLLIYDLPQEVMVHTGHKNVPVPERQPQTILPVVFEPTGFKGLSPYHGAAQVMLGIGSFAAWKLQQAPAPRSVEQ